MVCWASVCLTYNTLLSTSWINHYGDRGSGFITVYQYVLMCTCTYAHAHAYAHAHTCTDTHSHAHAHLHVYVRIFSPQPPWVQNSGNSYEIVERVNLLSGCKRSLWGCGVCRNQMLFFCYSFEFEKFLDCSCWLLPTSPVFRFPAIKASSLTVDYEI